MHRPLSGSKFHKEFSRIEQVWDCALLYLANRDYSLAEMDEKLSFRGATEEQRYEVLIKLKESGLINERRYAGRIYEYWLAKGSYGRAHLRMELQKHKLPAELREEIVDSFTDTLEEEHAFKAAKVFVKRWRGKRNAAADKRKIYGAAARFLATRGFSAGYMDLLLREMGENVDICCGNLDI